VSRGPEGPAAVLEHPARTPVAAPVPRPAPAVGVWWLSPVGAVLLVVPASLLGAWLIGDARYRAEWGTPKVLTGAFTVVLLLGLAALVLGASWSQLRSARVMRGRWPALSDADRAVLHRAGTWTFRATMAGYLAMGAIGLARGVSPVTLLLTLVTLDTSDALKASFAPVAGLTTFTQIGIAHAVVAGLLVQRRATSAADRLVRRRLVVVLVLGALRAFLLSERLAVLELMVPLVAIVGLRLSVHRRSAARRGIRLAPVVLLPVLLALFGAFEYARSWQFYKAHGGSSFVDFVVVRFAGYYATAYNNAGIADAHATFPGRLPYGVIEWFWTAPVVSQLGLYERFSGGSATDSFLIAIWQYGSPEFNNPGGLGVPFVDLGLVGGLLFLLAFGLLAGRCWASALAGRPVGMLLYPVLLTGLFELPRYLYLCQGRVLPALVVLALIARRLSSGPSPVAARVTRRLGRSALPRLLPGGAR
jgi:hypothetical protein